MASPDPELIIRLKPPKSKRRRNIIPAITMAFLTRRERREPKVGKV